VSLLPLIAFLFPIASLFLTFPFPRLPVKLRTVGSLVFPVVGPQIWINLPEHVTSAESLSTFHRRLKTRLFMKSSFPDCFFVSNLTNVRLYAYETIGYKMQQVNLLHQFSIHCSTLIL